MRRTVPLKRGGPLARHAELGRGAPRQRSGRLPYRSARTERVYAEQRRPLVAAMLAERPWCEIRWSRDVCQGRSDCVHEVLSRGRGGSIVDEGNCLASCGPCNTAVSDNPTEAEARGFLLKSGRPSKAVAR